LATSGTVLAHLHKIYTGMYPVYFLNSASAPTLLTADVLVPVSMAAPFNITMLSNLVINTATSLWASGATFTSANVQITVISTDVPPPLVFAFASQSLNLAGTGNSNVTTMTEGFMRESYSLMGFANATITQEQYVLPDGRGIIYQFSDQLRQQAQYKYPNITLGGMPNAVTGVVAAVAASPLLGEEIVEVSYMSGGVALPWTNAGRLVLTTATMVTTPTFVEILIAAPVKSQTKVGEAAQPTAMRPRTDLAAGGQTTPGTKPKVRY
jgi:hypothetical protein